jgi:hypothetical protein
MAARLLLPPSQLPRVTMIILWPEVLMKRPNRLDDLQLIAAKFSDLFGKRLVSAFAYGSSLGDDLGSLSDYDFLLFVKRPTLADLDKLKRLRRQYYARRKITLDINLHSATNTPELRQEAFWHHNRGYYFQIELQRFGKLLVGKDLFPFRSFPTIDLKLEAVRVINSLLYQTRKLLINATITRAERLLLLKWCLYAVLYSLAAKDVFPSSKSEATDCFEREYPALPSPRVFLSLKRANASGFSRSTLATIYSFLSALDAVVYDDYVKYRISINSPNPD